MAIVGPGQCGKTVCAENWLQKSVESDPADFLWYMQTDDGLESYVKGRINPLIELHEKMRQRRGRRSTDDSLHFKNFGAMRAEFLAFGDSTLRNKSAPRIVADEIDGYAWLGDVKPPLDVRRQTFGLQSMLLAMSHPDKARGLRPEQDWTSGIMAIYADSDRCAWWWPCPHCGAWSSPVPIASRVMVIDYPTDPDVPLDVIEREARLICPVNGCVIEDHERREMNLAAYRSPFGGWIGDGQELSEGGEVKGELVKRDTAGFWMVGAMSPFVLGGIGGLARQRVKAERDLEASGEEAGLKEVMVKWWGVPYQRPRQLGSVDAEQLVERAELGLEAGEVPNGVRFVTLAVDVQKWGFEYLYRGWGVDGESWPLETGRILANPATEPNDWDKLIALYERRLPLADGSGRTMAVRAFGYDSGGEKGVSLHAYAAWRRWRASKRVKFIGKISGREAWTVLPLRGASRLLAPRLQLTYPDTGRQANVAAAAGQVPQGYFNPNHFKDDLNAQLLRAEPGPWYVHVPAAFKASQAPHPWFEQLVAETRLPSGKWEKQVASARNEALDLMVMTHVMAHLFGLSRINWDAPPPWAAEWDANPFVSQRPGEPPKPPVPLSKRLA